MVARLPDEYQEVEYLESTGTQWIDTGIVPNKSMRVVVHGMSRNNINGASFFFGSRGTNNSCMFCGLIWGGYYQFELGNRRNVNITQAHAGERFFYDFNCDENHSVIANGTAYANSITITDAESQYDTPMLLFAIYTGRTVDSQRQPIRISSFTVYESYADANPIQNLVPCYRKSDNKPGMYDTVSGAFYVNSGTGEFLVGNNVYYDTTNLLESRRRILLTTPHLESPTPANPLTFKSNMTTKLKEGKVYFTPVQEGTGDPSPDNVRPILGWDWITVTRTGKNIFGGNAMLSAIANTNSTAVINGDEVTFRAVSNNRETIFNKFKENTQYSIIITGYKSMANIHINLAIEYTDGSVSSLTLPSGYVSNEQCTFIYVSTANRTIKCIRNHPANFQNFTLIGSLSGVFEGIVSEDAYEPYTETKITIPFPQTIYGGYVDLVNGEVVEEWCNLTFDGTDSKINRGGYYNASSDYFGAAMVYADPRAENVGNNVMCDKLKTYGEYMSSDYLPYLFACPTRRLYLCVVCGKMSEHPEITTDAQRIAFVNNWLNDNPIDVSYKIETPIHHTIDPQVIRPLKGANNIWSDANGNIEIKFWKH